ncbi:hypothetical protein EDB19DRAFT_1907228 [Suillus lakei]|nr:hypothetical protein EDB19DRAFT_1907228 [Suillus lakei]
MTSISSVSSHSSSDSSFICDQPFSRPVLPAHRHAYWEAVVLDTQFTMHLDSYICRTGDQILMNIVDAFRTADNLTPAALELQSIPEARFSAVALCFNQGKIKSALSNLLAARNFEDVVSKLEEEEAFNAPPDPVRVIARHVDDHGSISFPIRDFMRSLRPTISDEVVVEPPTPPAKESNEAGAALDEILRLTTEAEESVTPITTPKYHSQSERPNDFVPTVAIPQAVLDTTTAVPVPPPRRRNRRPCWQNILSYGLPPINAHRPLVSPFTDRTNEEHTLDVARLEASETTQTRRDNFVCRHCHAYGHRQKNCNQYYCRICRKFAPRHLTTYCPTLAGKHLLRRGPSAERFYKDLKKLEAAYDQDAARLEQDRAENEIEALDWLADIDLDPVYYDNMDD